MDTTQRLQRDQVRVASTRFLRVRPLVVCAGALVNGALLGTSNAPRAQAAAVAGVLAAAIVFFATESFVLRRREVTERWLFCSLLATAAALALAASLTGGVASPLLPILLAPAAVGALAFGRTAAARLVIGASAALIVLVFALPPLAPSVPADRRAAMGAVSLLVTLALVWLATTGIGEAHGRVAAALDRMRRGVIDEAALRAKEAEALGARVAHELRNPLTAAKALVELARRADLPDKDAKRLSVALEEMERMERTLSDYLSLARPLTDVNPERIDVGAVLDGTAALVEARAREAGVQVRVEAPAALSVLADPRRIREALLNLCLNGIAAMREGGQLTLSARQNGPLALIHVIDQGSGMSAEVASRIGEKFAPSTSGGSGLGLLLVKSVARMHGGALHVQSEPGHGTRMTLELPCEPTTSGLT
jgi:signal transduction histidine kinase